MGMLNEVWLVVYDYSDRIWGIYSCEAGAHAVANKLRDEGYSLVSVEHHFVKLGL